MKFRLLFGFLLLFLCSTVVSALTISIVTGDTASAVFIDFDVSRTVLQLKNNIDDDVFPNIKVKKLYFQDILLDHKLSLQDYGITEESTVEVNSSTWDEDGDLPTTGPNYIYANEGSPIQEDSTGNNKNKNKKSSGNKGKGKRKDKKEKKKKKKNDKKNKDKGKGKKNKPKSKKPGGTAIKGRSMYVGDGTAYSEAVPDGSGFACSFRKLFKHTKIYFAAINIEQWENGLSCGRCVNVLCTDPFCTVKNKKVKVQIVDQCPECKKGDIDLSIPAYRDVTGRWPHRLTVNWEWTSCEDIVDGDLLLSPKDGQNPWYHAFYLSNAANAIKKVTLNSKIEMSRNQFGFYHFQGELEQGPYTLRIVSIDGEMLTATVDTFLKSKDLGVQFQKFADGHDTTVWNAIATNKKPSIKKNKTKGKG